MKYAHSVIVELKREGLKLPFQLSYDGNAKDEFTAIRLDPLLPEEEIEQFHDFIVNWDYKTAGLFIDYNSVIGFVMIVENLFRDKYQIEYQWIGGANPYEAYMKSQDEDPIGTIY